ncbi:MAG: hypothetical protein HGA86_01600, partial [Anaerolineaceae bacterium]|nr:hypothetical protein [Anaerolineaceae bacterium]
ELDKKLVTFTSLGPDWEHLDFGINPAVYDDGYNPYGDERPNFFGDPRVRQAFAYCMDREGAIKQFLKAKTSVPLSYLPPNHPLYAGGLPEYAYDPAKGMELLDQAGWKDFDNDPSTPRVAATVNNVPAGKVFEVSYAFPDSPLRQQMAAYYQASLAKCGIKVDLAPKSSDEFYAPGPDGMIFGRQFDLAQFSWAAGQQPPCFLYESAEIPSRNNGWVGKRSGGVNITGYSNNQYDAVCESARQGGVSSTSYVDNQQEAQQILGAELPSIPLYYGVNIAAARPGICGVKLDISSRSDFANIEDLNSALQCDSK